jgi:hypothetical protein
MGMTMDEAGRLVAEGLSSHEMLRRITEEFGADPIPWNVLNAGRAYGWSAERTLGALALFMCWQQRETKRLLDRAVNCTNLLPYVGPGATPRVPQALGYDPKDPLYVIDHPMG